MSDKKLIVLIDSGDTLIDEGTQVFDEQGTVVSAAMIAGAGETIKALHDQGYPLVLVADGGAQSFKNVLTQNGLYDYFSALIY